MSFKVLTGELYIQVLLKKIALVRSIFIANFEQGYEVLIPYELSQEHLPASFRFYDPLIQIINENCREVIKCEFNLKTKLHVDRINNESFKFRVM